MKKIAYVIFSVVFSMTPAIVWADPPTDPVATPVGFDMTATEDAANTLNNAPIFITITVVMNWLLGLVGVLAVIAFVISGIMYLTSAGDEGQIEKAKATMMYAIIGLVVALIGLIVVNAIGGLTGVDGVTSY